MTIPAIPRNSSTESRYLLVFPGEKGTAGMANRALLVMDVRRDVVDVSDGRSGYLPRLRRAMDGARAASLPVIYMVIGSRPCRPEVRRRVPGQ